MKLTTGRNIKYLLIAHLAFLAAIAFYSLFIMDKPATQVLVPSFILVSILRFYSMLFLPISAGALFILIFLSDKYSAMENRGDSGKILLLSTIPVLIPTALIYFFLIFFAEPELIENREWLQEVSRSGEFYLQEAEKNLAEGNLEQALVFVDLYSYIDQNNRTAIEIKNSIKLAWPHPEEVSEENIITISGDIITGQKLVEIAESFYAQENYSSAAYYAQMAGGFRGSRDNAARILQNSIENLSGLLWGARPEEKLFNGKIDIVSRIESEDFYGAYYYFHLLSDEFPEDRELADIGTRLFSLLAENSFFYEDARLLYFAPGKTEIAFINSSNDSEKELVFAKKIVFSSDSIYFFDIDIINLSANGNIIKHIKSLYGKTIGNRLSMQCVGREIRLLLSPEIIAGDKSERISSIDLEFPLEAFRYMRIEETRLSKIKTPFLLNNLDLLSNVGAGKYAPAETLFIRFIRFFNYISMLLLVMTAGISFLKRRADKTYLSFFMLPIVVVAVYFIARAFLYIKSRILLIFMKETGITGAALCFIVITAIELIGIIFYTIIKGSSIEKYGE